MSWADEFDEHLQMLISGWKFYSPPCFKYCGGAPGQGRSSENGAYSTIQIAASKQPTS
jgi:hypothetical protein